MARIRSLSAGKEKPPAHSSDPPVPAGAPRGPAPDPGPGPGPGPGPAAEGSGAPGAAAGAGRRARAELRRRQINPAAAVSASNRRAGSGRGIGQFPPSISFFSNPPPSCLYPNSPAGREKNKKKKKKRRKAKSRTPGSPSRPPSSHSGPRGSFPAMPPQPPPPCPAPRHLQSRIPGTCPSAGRWWPPPPRCPRRPRSTCAGWSRWCGRASPRRRSWCKWCPSASCASSARPCAPRRDLHPRVAAGACGSWAARPASRLSPALFFLFIFFLLSSPAPRFPPATQLQCNSLLPLQTQLPPPSRAEPRSLGRFWGRYRQKEEGRPGSSQPGGRSAGNEQKQQLEE